MKTLFYLNLLCVCAMVGLAGSLDPTDPPGPTMKTLDEVEPRIPIPASDAPTTPFAINESGSYYLTGDRRCSTNGIEVDANDVTIDLMGYSLIGSGFNGSAGVDIYGRSNVEVKNGTVRAFYYGIDSNYTSAQGHRIINIRAVSNKNTGMNLYGERHLVKGCTVADNGSGGGSVRGINAGDFCIVTGNMVCDNGDSATIGVTGIGIGFGGTVINNTVNANGVSASCNNIYGIYVSAYATVIGNTVYKNGSNATSPTGNVYGIYLNGSTLVDQNTSVNNGYGAAASTKENIHDPGGSTITASNHAP